MTKTRLLLAGVLLLTFLGYSRGLSGPLFFDDQPALTSNPLVKIDGKEFDEWRTAALSSTSGITRRPVAMFTFTVNHVLSGGISAFGLKLVNTLLHLVIGCLIYAVAIPLFGLAHRGLTVADSRLLALAAAAIWLLHPLQVSTVLYAVQRMAQLSALFVVLGLLVFVRYRQRWAERGVRQGELAAALLWVGLTTLFAVYSKENGALLPGLILVVEVCLFRGAWRGGVSRRLYTGSAALLLLLGLALLLCMLFPPDFIVSRYGGREFSVEERLLTQSRVLWHYLYWLAVPNLGAMGFQHDDIILSRGLLEPVTTLLAMLAWVVALLVAATLRHRHPVLLFSLLFYLVSHSMESSLWPLEMVYEHRNYVPTIAVSMLLASVLVLPALRSERVSVVVPLLAIPLVLLPVLLIRADTWSDELTLSGVNVSNHPNSSRSNYFYANALLRKYRTRDESGLTEREARDALLASRHYFERMYALNNRDVAALVMLHSLDAQFAGDSPDRIDWLAELEELLKTRVLQASDLNALGALIECVNAGGCAAEKDRVLRILNDLGIRLPRNVAILGWKYSYLLSQGAPPEELEMILHHALEIRPGRSSFRYRLIEQYAETDNVGGMYESAGQWLLRDKRRLETANLKKLFSSASPDGE